MKTDFEKAVKKAELFAEQAMVVTLSFTEVSTKSTVTHRDGTQEVSEKHFKPEELREAFLDYLKQEKIPHAVILKEPHSLSLAMPRETKEGEKSARAAVNAFFKGGRQAALAMQAYYQKYDSQAALKNTLLSPFSKTRREVNRAVAGFQRKK
ncbi:MAG: hypothetical protein EA357_06950 [Micavibrio sp.]|nr:MAG: hypothetical protein EA357_06950 [Micavibrio sp.]